MKIDVTFMPSYLPIIDYSKLYILKSRILGFKEFNSVMLMRSLLKNIYKFLMHVNPIIIFQNKTLIM